jgi:hypothetical protein
VAFEPALIERVEVVRIAPARRFVVFEDEPAVLYPRRAWFPRAGWPAPARVGRIVYDIPRGPRALQPGRSGSSRCRPTHPASARGGGRAGAGFIACSTTRT